MLHLWHFQATGAGDLGAGEAAASVSFMVGRVGMRGFLGDWAVLTIATFSIGRFSRAEGSFAVVSGPSSAPSTTGFRESFVWCNGRCGCGKW